MKRNEVFIGILREGGGALALRVSGAFISLLLTIVISRNFVSGEVGSYFFILSAVTFLSSIAMLGLQNATIKQVAIHSDSDIYVSDVLTKSSVLLTLASIAICLIFYGLMKLFSSSGDGHEILDEYYWVILILLIPFSLMLIVSAILQGLGSIMVSMCLAGISYQFVLLIVCTTVDLTSMEHLFWMVLLSISLSVLIGFVVLNFKYRVRFKVVGLVEYRFLFSLAFPMMIGQVVSQASIFLGQFLVSIYATPSDIAHYSVALRVASLMSFVVFAINRISAPKFARLHSNNEVSRMNQVVIYSNRLLWFVSVPQLLIIVFFGKDILRMFGEDYTAAYNLLVVISFGQFISCISGSVSFLLQMTGNEKVMRNNVIVAFSVSSILGLFLVPVVGVVGAAWMTFISLALTNLLACFWSRSILGINPLKVF